MIVISVIIPTKNRSKMLLQCVESLIDQKADNYEIIIVDDGSEDDTKAVIGSQMEIYHYIRYIFNESSRGSYFCRNQGAGEANGEVFAFIDDDCIASPDWVSLIEELFESGEVDAVQGDPTLTVSTGFWIKLESARISYDPNYFWVDTKNFAVRKDVFFEIGGFDGDFKSSGDVAFGIRLQERKKNLILSKKLQVFHQVENSPVKLLRNISRYAYGDYLVNEKYRKLSIFDKFKQTLKIPTYGLGKIKVNPRLNGYEKIAFLVFYITHYLIRDSFFYIYSVREACEENLKCM